MPMWDSLARGAVVAKERCYGLNSHAMKKRSTSLMLVVAAVCSTAAAEHVSAQSVHSSGVPRSGVVLTKLSDSTFPPLARQARIAGDVDLMLAIRRDGSVASVVVVSGHPMLKSAAVDSAQRSQFGCGGCGDAVTLYALKYKFSITPRDPPKDCTTPTEADPPVEIDPSGHQVTVSAAEIWTCDPEARSFKVRSPKCLYLWRCATRYEL
jgi:hypothetical protein